MFNVGTGMLHMFNTQQSHPTKQEAYYLFPSSTLRSTPQGTPFKPPTQLFLSPSLIYKTAMSPPKAAATTPDPAAQGKMLAAIPVEIGAGALVPDEEPAALEDEGAAVVSAVVEAPAELDPVSLGPADVSEPDEAGEALSLDVASAELSAGVDVGAATGLAATQEQTAAAEA